MIEVWLLYFWIGGQYLAVDRLPNEQACVELFEKVIPNHKTNFSTGYRCIMHKVYMK